ncbi:MAG: hypothetical protein IPO78_08350 [Saprospiraceae bacterium]|nr:hypothetical protein [Saprospiraceae bacterium]MBK9721620.1 hypothetical protein [Saprospiraceae bacterium]
MLKAFKDLKPEEYQLLIDAVPMIAILIAGADNDIDLKERQWAEKIVKIRSYSNQFDLKPLYKEVDEQFSMLFDKMIEELPKDADNRSRILSSKLAGLNDVFLKLNMRTSNQLYTSYIAYAEQIARASGGILRMLAVSKEECIFIGLPMIDPIFYNDIEEEEE